jgi:hypothetical protein
MARNEALFREVNEHVAGVSVRVDGAGELDFLCECADESCTEAVALRRDEYESVRGEPRQFVIVPGHSVADIERVIAEGERYAVVRKTGVAGRLAEASDPRGRA